MSKIPRLTRSPSDALPSQTQDLGNFDWEQLQGKYNDAMAEHCQVEENLRIEISKLLEVSFRCTHLGCI